MMKKSIRLVAGILIAMLLIASFASCNSDKDGQDTSESESSDIETTETSDTNDTSGTDSQSESQNNTLDAADALILATKGKSQYVLVVDDDANAAIQTAVSDFAARFTNRTKASLKTKTDNERSTDKEILIGIMDEREETQVAAEQLFAPGGKGYRISVEGSKIVLISAEEYLGEAVKLLASAILPCGEDSFGIEKNYVGEMDIPECEASGEMYTADEGNYTYNVSNISKRDYNEWVDQLRGENFSLHSKHTIGQSSFATYYKDSIYGSQVLYVSYHGALKTMRMTWGPLEYLPPVEEIRADNKATPTITQMHLQMVDNGFNGNTNTGAPGMSYLLQLSDGRFIVIDGGNSDQTINVAVQGANGEWALGNKITTTDEKRLYDTMCEMMPSDAQRPTVAMWFFSHVHGDHMDLAISFLQNYAGKINLELVAYNFLNFYEYPSIAIFRSRIEKNFPEADTWIMHTGQTMQLPDCTIEVLSTPEDFVCTGNQLTDANDASVVIRITLANTSFMVLGDAYPTTSEFMRDAYGDALQSDVLQMSHHGFEGSAMTADFYTCIDPKICLWPCDEFRFQNDPRNTGSHGLFKMNWWLRNEPWTRGNDSGTRLHYTASYMTTIDATTGKKIP